MHRDVKPENLLMPALEGADADAALEVRPSGPGDPFGIPPLGLQLQNVLDQSTLGGAPPADNTEKKPPASADAPLAPADPNAIASLGVPRLPPSMLVAPPGPPGASTAPRPLAKLADFGLARRLEDPAPYTEYVSTRWYRSPELLLRSPTHDPPADIFAAGAVFYEALAGRPLFPGDSEAGMLGLFAEAMGTPTQAGWDQGATLADELGVVFASDLQGQGAAPGSPNYAARAGPAPPVAALGKLRHGPGATVYPWQMPNAVDLDVTDPARTSSGPSLARAILDPSLSTPIAAPGLVSPGAARIIAAMCAWDPARRPTAGDLLRAAVLGSPLSSRLLERAPLRLPRSELRAKLAKAMRHALTSEWTNGRGKRLEGREVGQTVAGANELAGTVATAAPLPSAILAEAGRARALPYPLESRGGRLSERTPSPTLDADTGRPRPRSRRPFASHGWARAAASGGRGHTAEHKGNRGHGAPSMAGEQPTPMLNTGINAHIHAQIQPNLLAQRGDELPPDPSGLPPRAAPDQFLGGRLPTTLSQAPPSPTLSNFTAAADTVIERSVEMSRQPSFLAGPWGPELRLEGSLGASSTVDGRRATIGTSRGDGTGDAGGSGGGGGGDDGITSPRARGRETKDATGTARWQAGMPSTARGGRAESRARSGQAAMGAPLASARGQAPAQRMPGHRSLAVLQRRRLGGSLGHALDAGEGGVALATSRFLTDDGHPPLAAGPQRGRGAPVGGGRRPGGGRPPRPPAGKGGEDAEAALGKQPQPAELPRAPASSAGTSDGTWVIPAVKTDGSSSHPPE